uniref:Selenoprotein O n=1 Tax=Neogobius melanostomus TaxID=47308 RepID=A0A8C6V184_9GOBI
MSLAWANPALTTVCGLCFRDGDGRKVLRSSVREFLCSEALAALGIPTTRAASIVTSDVSVHRDPLRDGRRVPERCAVVMRVAPSFIRFGSFEIFLQRDEFSGLEGPSAGRHDLRAQLLDYVIEHFYPETQHFSDRKQRNAAFFRAVMERTARLVAQWQSVGFCHGVLNTDNMSILGLTLDYGPFAFMDRYDPDFVSNSSDTRGRYSFSSQPSVCRWNLARLAEALGSELNPPEAGDILDDFMPTYEALYLGNMRRKLGLGREEPQDGELISDLLQLMHNTGADFTNTFRLLSLVPWPEQEHSQRDPEEDGGTVDSVVEHILQQCASIEELKVSNQPTMEQRELAMILSMAQSNSAMFSLVSEQPEVSRQLQRMWRLKSSWRRMKTAKGKTTRRLGSLLEASVVKKERLKMMKKSNPRVVLRNYICHSAVQEAERGDFSEVGEMECVRDCDLFLCLSRYISNFHDGHKTRYNRSE